MYVRTYHTLRAPVDEMMAKTNFFFLFAARKLDSKCAQDFGEDFGQDFPTNFCPIFDRMFTKV